MASTHSWQGAATQSNKKEQARVAKKYKGVKKIGVDSSKAASDDDPFQEDDPILDTMAIGRRHDSRQYAKAAALPLKRAKEILKESEK
jgi:hypothetical protein